MSELRWQVTTAISREVSRATHDNSRKVSFGVAENFGQFLAETETVAETRILGRNWPKPKPKFRSVSNRNTAKTNPFYFINPRHILKLISINIDNSNSILSQQLVG